MIPSTRRRTGLTAGSLPLLAGAALGLPGCSEEPGVPFSLPFLEIEWQLVAIGTVDTAIDATPVSPPVTARFRPETKGGRTGTMEGFAGCNGYGARYQSESGAELTIIEVFSTLKWCGSQSGHSLGTQVEQAFLPRLLHTVSYRQDGNVLRLFTSQGDTLAFQAPGGNLRGILGGNARRVLRAGWK